MNGGVRVGKKNRGQHWQMVWEIGQRGGGRSGRRVKEKGSPIQNVVTTDFRESTEGERG